ncbi:MAG: maleylpyruvate isomerase N-terminal domain-containing protein, partial [Gemmatimonadota bacterium]|nr:maleylpyruvate isomerase N-terminal domain-containing protein [Gemmatimonadota bacterium]
GLHAELMALLRGLAPADWSRPTACALWSVKDITAHLLDTTLRRLSFGRDGLETAPDTAISGYSDLVAYLNRLNAEWTTATRRLSPPVLIDLLDFTSGQVHAFFQSLDPHSPARFPVSWAGEDVSPNWFDIGREYTERPRPHRTGVASSHSRYLCARASIRVPGGGGTGGLPCPLRDRR